MEGNRDISRKEGESTTQQNHSLEIAEHTFNTGENKYVAQFTRSHEEVANYMQRMSVEEGYLVAETVQTGKQQLIPLPPPINPNVEDKADLEII